MPVVSLWEQGMGKEFQRVSAKREFGRRMRPLPAGTTRVPPYSSSLKAARWPRLPSAARNSRTRLEIALLRDPLLLAGALDEWHHRGEVRSERGIEAVTPDDVMRIVVGDLRVPFGVLPNECLER